MKSLSEIETTAKRASRAAGYSWGIAEEVGKSIRLFELFGFPAIKHLNQYYQNKKKENFDDIKLIFKISEYLFSKIFFKSPTLRSVGILKYFSSSELICATNG